MATTKPRLTFTASHELAAVLKRLAAVQGRPVSGVVSEYLEITVPVLERVADAMERALAAQAEARAGIVAGLQDAQAQAEPALALLLDALNAAAGPSAEGANPRSCNNGGQVSFNALNFNHNGTDKGGTV